MMKFGPTLEELRGGMPATVAAQDLKVQNRPKAKRPFRESGTAALFMLLAIVCGPVLVIWIAGHFAQVFFDSLSTRNLLTFFACVVTYFLFLIWLAIKEVTKNVSSEFGMAIHEVQEVFVELKELKQLTKDLTQELEWYKAGTLGHELVDELRSIARSAEAIRSDTTQIEVNTGN